MAKKKQDAPIAADHNIITQSMEEVVHSSMIPFAEYVILERALPRVEDGLKPVQRRILFTMMEMNVLPDRPYRKSARIVGDCMGKYHPHGDTSIYDAMARMAQDFSMRAMLVDGQGNFGSVDGDSPAAMRYTEARMAPLALEMLRDLDKDTVNYSLNFDDTLKEPDTLPSRYPNLLVNGSSGIAVGLATNIPPHNLGEAVDAVVALIDNPKLTLEQAMQALPGPDFPTGGLIMGREEIKKAYQTGRGKLTVRAKCTIEPGPAGRKLIVVHELPYQVNKAAMLEKILRLSEEKKGVLSAISDIRDESDRTGMRAVVELKRDADADKVLQYLYKYSDLQVTFGVNMVAIAGGKPQTLGLMAVLRYYLDYQKQVVTRRTQFDLEAARKRAHILEGLIRALDDLDRAIAIIRGSQNPRQAREGLMEAFSLDEEQAQAILDMRLQRLTGLEILNLQKEYQQLLKTMEGLQAILKSERKLLGVIRRELLEIKERFADPRRTHIEDEAKAEVPEAIFSVVEDVYLTFTRGGFVKRYAKPPKREEGDLKPLECAQYALSIKSNNKLMAVTHLGNCYQFAVDGIAETKGRERGQALAQIIPGFDPRERLVGLWPMTEMNEQGTLIFFTRSGMVKRAKMTDFITNRTKILAMGLKGEDRIVHAQVFAEGQPAVLVSAKSFAICFDSADIPVQGRSAGGVKGIALGLEDTVAFARQTPQEGELVVMTDRGYGKRVLMVDLPIQGRGGKGNRLLDMKKQGANGSAVAGCSHVAQPYTLAVVQRHGELTRLDTEAFPIENRFTKAQPMVLAMMDNTVESIFPLLEG